ncbi:hypothetical protein ONZ51_g2652 [Trametes cubensis]|uniref:Zn(2)-C6 fungal-type domain-containing protein n=1 Tax=Trametes cubensis TaxID=1111947 RepID=A0AAD7TZY5_9APHY|nr:hypothetical protein ONZ51_g2652 [Trametes cubensis]
MSTAHLSLDDFAFPPHRPHSAYELPYALGAPQSSSSIYPQSHLDPSTLASHSSRHLHQIPSDSSQSLYLPENPEAYLNPYTSSGIAYPYLDSHLSQYSLLHRPTSPHSVYTATSGWAAPDPYGAPYDAAASSSSFLHNLQNVIDSTHTSQVQQSANAAQAAAVAAAAQRSSSPSSSSWTLSGSLDPTTGVFQRSVEHPRLRTAQACEKCRIRKAKCSGDHPACQRCISRGLQCEYAPERKMRGPNKNKRKSISQKRSETSPSGSDNRRSSIASIASTVSSSSDADPSQHAATAAAAANSTSRPQSRASPHSAALPVADAPRPRATTVTVGALQRAVEHQQLPSGPSPTRQRPPPLQLDGAARQFYPSYPNLVSQYTRANELSTAYGTHEHEGNSSDTSTITAESQARPASLPPYLLEAYSRIALANNEHAQESAFHDPSPFVMAPGTTTTMTAAPSTSTESSGMARSHAFHQHQHHPSLLSSSSSSEFPSDLSAYLNSSPADALSVYSNPRSNSSDMSAPITPLSLSSDGLHDSGMHEHELGYSDDYASTAGPGPLDLSGFAHDDSVLGGTGGGQHSYADMQAAFSGMEDIFRPKSAPAEVSGAADDWDVVMLADDETPRADTDRKLSHVGRLLADASA